jgi:hypothetical protein
MDDTRQRILAILRFAQLRRAESSTTYESSVRDSPIRNQVNSKLQSKKEKYVPKMAPHVGLLQQLIILWKRRAQDLAPSRELKFLREVETSLYLPKTSDYEK